jgi:FixJ family two-component response regulator
VLTRSEQNRVVEAIVAGASGYILKSAPPEAIISAVRATAAGESVLSPQVAGKLLQRIRELDIPVKNTNSAAAAIRAALTDRELEIFKRLASGHSNHEIARELSLSTNTIANPHRQHPRQAPPREPHPSSRPSRAQRNLVTATTSSPQPDASRRGCDAGYGWVTRVIP